MIPHLFSWQSLQLDVIITLHPQMHKFVPQKDKELAHSHTSSKWMALEYAYKASCSLSKVTLAKQTLLPIISGRGAIQPISCFPGHVA